MQNLAKVPRRHHFNPIQDVLTGNSSSSVVEVGNKVLHHYPLHHALRKAKLINNTAFVYLAIRYQHPFGDRPIRVRTKEFTFEWGIPESSLYEAISTLKREKVIKIHTRELVIEWNSQQDSGFSESRVYSGIA